MRIDDCFAESEWLGPTLEANRLSARFAAWQSGIGDSLRDGLAAYRSETGQPEANAPSFSLEAEDRAAESYCRSKLLHSLWTELQQNCVLSAKRGGAIHLLAQCLRSLARTMSSGIEVHLVGHSAGCLLLGHLLSRLRSLENLSIGSITLLAPACSTDFAMRHFGKAVSEGLINPKRLALHMLSDRWESQAGFAGLHSRSLLYLVSRALERVHKTPLIGMERVALEEPDRRRWNESYLSSMESWQNLLTSVPDRNRHVYASDNTTGSAPPSHLDFLGNPHVIRKTIQHIKRTRDADKIKVLPRRSDTAPAV